jgi:leucine dehydrogenase
VHLLEAGAKLIITDLSEEKRAAARALDGVRVVDDPNAIYDEVCDIFAPCGLGGVLNTGTIPRLQCSVVCGGANNQLADDSSDNQLAERGILYAPDFVANAGGVINVYYELGRTYDREAAMEKTSHIYESMEQVFSIAKAQGITTAEAADHLAEQRIAAGRKAS